MHRTEIEKGLMPRYVTGTVDAPSVVSHAIIGIPRSRLALSRAMPNCPELMGPFSSAQRGFVATKDKTLIAGITHAPARHL